MRHQCRTPCTDGIQSSNRMFSAQTCCVKQYKQACKPAQAGALIAVATPHQVQCTFATHALHPPHTSTAVLGPLESRLHTSLGTRLPTRPWTFAANTSCHFALLLLRAPTPIILLLLLHTPTAHILPLLLLWWWWWWWRRRWWSLLYCGCRGGG